MAHSASLAAKAPEDAPIATAADASGPEDGMQADAVDDDDLVAPAPTFLTCRLHGGLLQQPVISKCGHSFCQACAERALAAAQPCPQDGTPLPSAGELWPNLVAAEHVRELTVRCRHRLPRLAGLVDPAELGDTGGCTAQMPLKERRSHEATCAYRPVTCPNAPACGAPPMLAMRLDDHLATCACFPCPFVKTGCAFRGRRSEVDGHCQSCAVGAAERTQARVEVAALQEELDAKATDARSLEATVRQLADRMDRLEASSLSAASLQRQLDQVLATIQSWSATLADLNAKVDALNTRVGALDEVNVMAHQYNCVGTYVGHGGPVWCLAIGPDNLIFSGSADQRIRVMAGHTGVVCALAYHDRKLYSGSDDGSLRVWSVDTYQSLMRVENQSGGVCALLIVTAPRLLLISGSHRTVTVWDPETMQEVARINGHSRHWVRALAAAEDELYTGSYNAVDVWSLRDFSLLRTIRVPGNAVYALAIDPIHKYLCVGSYESVITVVDLESGAIKAHLTGHTATVYSLAVSNVRPSRLFSGSYDGTVRIWSLENMQCVQVLARHTSAVQAVAFARGRLFTGAGDHTLKMWV